MTVTHELKTVALQQVLGAHKFDALVTGIRRDEDSTRAKERYFSPRNAEFEWDYKDQPPEFWNHFTTEVGPGEHVRVQPLLDWTETDIWRYLDREKVPLPGMYFSRNGERYRSLGEKNITAVQSASGTFASAKYISSVAPSSVAQISGEISTSTSEKRREARPCPIVKVKTPGTVGVPVMVPALGSRAKVPGRAPVVTA